MGRNPKEKFFCSRGHASQGAGQFSRNLLSAELHRSVQSLWYSSGTFFRENIYGHDFLEEANFFLKLRNSYSTYCIVQLLHFTGGMEIEMGIEIEVGIEFEVGTKIEKSGTVINVEINVVVNYLSA